MPDTIDTLKWALGIATAGLTAVITAWAVRRFGPAKESLDSSVVELTFTANEIAELTRIFNAIPKPDGDAQGQVLASIILRGWAGSRVIDSGKPGTVYVMKIQELGGVKTGIDRLMLWASPRFERPPHKNCVRLTVRATVNGVSKSLLKMFFA